MARTEEQPLTHKMELFPTTLWTDAFVYTPIYQITDLCSMHWVPGLFLSISRLVLVSAGSLAVLVIQGEQYRLVHLVFIFSWGSQLITEINCSYYEKIKY